ncbi:biotin--[acetyl-CoA-carboxylase] ligase [Sinomonas atrocyanea]|uniref:biotin--[acetyl-CoA-carboxylase] ligase n=1 Tax=Sinomonas atrocyanea TaxID=37927 RepID=UPI00285B311E|nr:biotin--[acetyl-CoA-carboxylase] ligase [Sinomonas atrocyanea]MDR6621781.1 BirA family biotin operon repressor/biotin-[acetyl-CoA-carboxylase] ligase [Sinomonas atrocyanea]
MDDHAQPESRGPLDATLLGPGLAREAGLSRLEVVGEIDSTNAELLRRAEADPDGWGDLSVLVADHQTAGRGRLHRHWESPVGVAVAVSVVLRPHNAAGRPLPTQSYSWFSPLAALALREALAETAGVEASVKWPNDVVVDGLKISGILAQLAPGAHGAPPAVVLGTGINVGQAEGELPVPTATSLAIATGREHRREGILAAYLTAFARRYRQFCAVDGDPDAPLAAGRGLWGQVEDATITLGKRVRVELPGGQTLVGRATGLDAHGALRVVEEDGTRHSVAAGDVVHLRPADGGYA